MSYNSEKQSKPIKSISKQFNKNKIKTIFTNIFYIFVIICLGIIIGLNINDTEIFNQNNNNNNQINNNNNNQKSSTNNTIIYKSISKKEPYILNQKNSVKLRLPAIRENVDEEEKEENQKESVPAFIEVTVMPGTGSIFLTLNNILSRHDTQESIRTAYEIASIYTNKSFDDIDIIYNLVADASMLQGPSAGAAFTIATIAAIDNLELKENVRITGTINHDGSIGPAGKIKEKAIGSKEDGANILLVSMGTSTEYIEKEVCNDYGLFENYCQIDYIPQTIGEDIENLEIIEVRYIENALKYMIEGVI
jgi:predicted S18 family serine protease